VVASMGERPAHIPDCGAHMLDLRIPTTGRSRWPLSVERGRHVLKGHQIAAPRHRALLGAPADRTYSQGRCGEPGRVHEEVFSGPVA